MNIVLSRFGVAFAAACTAFVTQVASAQDSATTLARMARLADAVVHVRVLATEPFGQTRATAVFRVQRVLTANGDLETGLEQGTVFRLDEPLGRACGRAIHGILPGSSYLVFLRAGSTPTEPKAFGGGARSIVRLEPGLIAHVEALRTATSPAAIRDVLIDNLSANSDRVRTDAAHALPTAAGLEGITADQSNTLLAVLLDAVRTEDRTAPALLVATNRASIRAAFAPLFDAYFDELRTPALDGMLARTLVFLDPSAAEQGVQEIADGSAREQVAGATIATATSTRAIQLLSKLPAQSARAALSTYASAADPSTRFAAGVTWLRLGLDTEELATTLDSPTDFANCCAAVEEAPIRLRSIRRPGR